MALQLAAIVGALALVEKCLDIPLVKRLLKNMAAGSVNKFDDFLIAAIYGTPEEKVPEKLKEVQKDYDATPEATREKMKAEPSAIPPETIKAAVEAAPFKIAGVD